MNFSIVFAVNLKDSTDEKQHTHSTHALLPQSVYLMLGLYMPSGASHLSAIMASLKK